MSRTAVVFRRWGEALSDRIVPSRLLALGGVAAVVGAFLSVLRRVLLVTGDPTTLYYIVALAVALGTIAAMVIRPRSAAAIALVAFTGGTYLYFRSIPGGAGFLVSIAPMIDDATRLLSGLSVLRILNADLWSLSAAPVPVFLAGYFGIRRQYVAASTVGAAALGIVILTGDATVAETFAGVLGVTVAVAVGDCERRGERLSDADGTVVVVTAMVVLTLLTGGVPAVAGSLFSTGDGGSGTTMESSLVYAGESIAIAGSVELSSESRYTVEADERAYWRVGTYDRYTGEGWVRTGSTRDYIGGLAGPPGESRTVQQRYTAETEIATLPAANRPTQLDDPPVPIQITEGGSFAPVGSLQDGDSYVVESERPVATAGDLQTSGRDYPEGMEEQYTQLPEDTPDRVGDRTERLTANAENPYETARVIEYWFRQEYEYSLDVDRPQGGVADAFLFEMGAGYCTYFATTMTTMLRTQGIPARFVVGYTPGEQVEENEWLVRGYNSHAWVEVYFPEHGWVEFDPTPAGPRRAAEQQTLNETASTETRALTAADVRATNESVAPENETIAADNETAVTPSGGGANEDAFSLSSTPLPTGDQIPSILVVIAASVAVLYRDGTGRRIYRALWLRRLPGGDPDAVAVGAYRRAIYLEAQRGRTKEPTQTPRQFFADADSRLQRIAERYERVRYGDGIDEPTAQALRADLAELLAERSRVPQLIEKPATGSR
jgi:transglutaminase-like putative cysteine protease